MSVTYVPIYGLLFRFMRFTLASSYIHRNSIVWRRVIFAIFPYLLKKRTRMISAILVFTGNAQLQWIWSDNFWSRDSAAPMTVGEEHRLYNKNRLFSTNIVKDDGTILNSYKYSFIWVQGTFGKYWIVFFLKQQFFNGPVVSKQGDFFQVGHVLLGQ